MKVKENIRAHLSTHDLTRRSTLKSLPKEEMQILSTHDLTRRSTIQCSPFRLLGLLSTHDLTRRSTVIKRSQHSGSESFNSRPHTEVDSDRFNIDDYNRIFQLTTSHGGRQKKTSQSTREIFFQLTTSHGGRPSIAP